MIFVQLLFSLFWLEDFYLAMKWLAAPYKMIETGRIKVYLPWTEMIASTSAHLIDISIAAKMFELV